MLRFIAVIVATAACPQLVVHAAGEESWEFQGEFVSLGKDKPGMVLIQTSGGLVEIPLAALSSADRAAVEKLAGVSGAPKAASEGLPKALADDLAGCATAVEAVDLCTLAVADPNLAATVREALELLRADLESRANRGEIRFGNAWASPDAVRKASEKAGEHLASAAEMMRLGNVKLVEQELRKASQADPSNGQADFLIGLAFMLGNRPDYDKAEDSFEEVLGRQPANGPAWNNLGVCKSRQRRFTEALEAFRFAGRELASREAAVSNLAVLITFAADRRSRISTRELEDIKTLYQELAKGQGGLAAPAGGPVVLSPVGVPVVAGGMNDLSSLLSPPPATLPPESPELMGLVVAADVVLCSLPKDMTSVRDGLVVVTSDGRNLATRRIATTPDSALFLLKCEGLGLDPLPLAAGAPSPGDSTTIVNPVFGSAQSGAEANSAAKVLTATSTSTERPRFVLDVGRAAGNSLAGAVVLDAAGRLVGLGVVQPPAPRTAGSRRLVVPVDVVWKMIKQLDESITPKGDQSDKEQLASTEAASRCQAAVVRVRTGQPLSPKP